MTRRQSASDVSIGKFDILATYAYARAVLDGHDEDEARQRGMVAAIMGAQSRLGLRDRAAEDDYKAHKAAPESKKKTTTTAGLFNKQVAHKMGPFFEKVFRPEIRRLVEAGLSYDDVKRLVKIPRHWGAKITGVQFLERVASSSTIPDHRPKSSAWPERIPTIRPLAAGTSLACRD